MDYDRRLSKRMSRMLRYEGERADMNDDGSADDACVATELDQMVLNPDNGDLLLTDGNVAKVTISKRLTTTPAILTG